MPRPTPCLVAWPVPPPLGTSGWRNVTESAIACHTTLTTAGERLFGSHCEGVLNNRCTLLVYIYAGYSGSYTLGRLLAYHVLQKRVAGAMPTRHPRLASSHQTSMRSTVIRNGSYLAGWIASLSTEQRVVLHYPMPGHPYWTAETSRLVAMRYGPSWQQAPYLHVATSGTGTNGTNQAVARL